MTSIDEWFRERMTVPTARLAGEVRVSVVHDRHLGPTWERAGVVLEVAPSDAFDVELLPGVGNAEEQEYATATALGFLDVAMVNTPFPLRDVRLRILQLIVDPVGSSHMAFREAGRQAARKVLEGLRKKSA